MQEIIDNLTEEQKRDLINALYKVDEILENNTNDCEGYHGTQFYNGLYDLMYRLGQWC